MLIGGLRLSVYFRNVSEGIIRRILTHLLFSDLFSEEETHLAYSVFFHVFSLDTPGIYIPLTVIFLCIYEPDANVIV